MDRLPIAGSGGLVVTLLFAYGAAMLSNFMSNTAAANVLIPIALAIGGSAGSAMVVPLALLAMHRLTLSRNWIDVLWLGLAVAGIGLSRYQMLIMSAPLLLLAAPPVAFMMNGFRALTLIFNPHSDIATIHNAQGIAVLMAGLSVLAVT